MLKTDLFDEAFGAGLLERLTPGSAMSVGLDRSFQTSQAARRRLGRSEVCTSDVRQLPFASDVFDLVLSISTLDHFERAADISAALEELWRVTAPGGHLILTLDNAANPVVALRNRLPFSWTHRLGLVPYFVGATCGPRDGADRLRSAGFTVRDTTAVMHCPRVVGVLASRAAERLGGRAARAFLEMARRFEWLEGWPSRYRTGYFVSYLAEKTR
jgi:SAM-dependent methyltransferase